MKFSVISSVKALHLALWQKTIVEFLLNASSLYNTNKTTIDKQGLCSLALTDGLTRQKQLIYYWTFKTKTADLTGKLMY